MCEGERVRRVGRPLPSGQLKQSLRPCALAQEEQRVTKVRCNERATPMPPAVFVRVRAVSFSRSRGAADVAGQTAGFRRSGSPPTAGFRV